MSIGADQEENDRGLREAGRPAYQPEHDAPAPEVGPEYRAEWTQVARAAAVAESMAIREGAHTMARQFAEIAGTASQRLDPVASAIFGGDRPDRGNRLLEALLSADVSDEEVRDALAFLKRHEQDARVRRQQRRSKSRAAKPAPTQDLVGTVGMHPDYGFPTVDGEVLPRPTKRQGAEYRALVNGLREGDRVRYRMRGSEIIEVEGLRC